MIIKPQFKSGFAFSDGLARVRVDEKFGFIDRTGALAIKPQFANARDFSDGLAAVTDAMISGARVRTCYIDMSGSIVWKSEN